jgi:hypothetical protein
MYVIKRIINGNGSSKKKLWLVIYRLSMNPSVINVLIDLQTDKARQKQIIRFILSVYPSVNITYHQQNSICNFVGVLIPAVVFAIVLFQLSGIYRQNSYVGNSIGYSSICRNFFFNSLEYTNDLVSLVTTSVIFKKNIEKNN